MTESLKSSSSGKKGNFSDLNLGRKKGKSEIIINDCSRSTGHRSIKEVKPATISLFSGNGRSIASFSLVHNQKISKHCPMHMLSPSPPLTEGLMNRSGLSEILHIP